MNTAASLLTSIYHKRTVEAPDGEILPLHSEISKEEGWLLQSLVLADPTITRTVEVGCAYGLSSLNICAALETRPGAVHTIIDPFQKTSWKSAGLSNLKKAGLTNFHWIEELSEIALPQLLSKYEAEIDLVFIDGMHTFDHALLDCFYSLRLLKVGGYLVLDDAHFHAIAKLVSYLERYPNLIKYANVPYSETRMHVRMLRRAFSIPPLALAFPILTQRLQRMLRDQHSMVAFKKTKEDARPFDWFAEF
jgi:predicted O-methyltransferase YrrM